jgi:hypothetical protein
VLLPDDVDEKSGLTIKEVVQSNHPFAMTPPPLLCIHTTKRRTCPTLMSITPQLNRWLEICLGPLGWDLWTHKLCQIGF